MRPLSDNFTRSFELFPILIAHCNDERDIRIYNIALLTNCVAHIESKINEKLQHLQTRKAFLEADYQDINTACDITSIKKTEKISEKWDRIKNMESSPNKWDNGNLIFSNFSSLCSLRNEVLHYKCDYLAAGEVPIKRIKNIMNQVCDEQPYGKKLYHKQMYESWCSYLLLHKKLAEWSIETTKTLEKNL
ncbi:MAG: hypothetical protein KAJ29_06485 [Alphaproteobacteria bacterium]|nr:hypothetical protein [Alphaproteobacteria bacterium]